MYKHAQTILFFLNESNNQCKEYLIVQELTKRLKNTFMS